MKTTYYRSYALLTLLLVFSGAFWLAGADALIDLLRNGTSRARMPFDFDQRGQAISTLTEEARHAGARSGDTVLEFGGRRFTGVAVMHDVVRLAQPGDVVRAVVRRPGAGEIPLLVRLAPRFDSPPTLSVWLRDIGIDLVFPLFCLCLGFRVAAARPLDRNAWFLLGIMISLGFLMPVGEWKDPWRELCDAWDQLCALTWPVWMLLFAIHFPERARADRRYPWIKWLIIAWVLVPGVILFASRVGNNFSFRLVAGLDPLLPASATANMLGSMIAVGLFFALLGYKSGTSSSSDARRRIRLVWLGAFAGLTPTFIVILIGLFTGAGFDYDVPSWLFYFSLACLAIFPLTLAYVILVQRAMDVRVAVRQSARYALARGALWLLRALLVALAILIFLNLQRQEFHPFAETALIVLALLLILFRERFTRRISEWMDKRFFREAYSAEKILSELGNEARRFVETRPLLDTVTRRISETLHIPRVQVLLRGEDGFHSEPASGAALSLAQDARSIQILKASHQPAVVYFDDPNSWLQEASPEEVEALKQLDAQLLLPLSGREDLLGVMALGPKLSEEPYSKMDLQLLQSVSAQTGLALENGQLLSTLAEEAARRERLHRELEIAREVQERLFPQSYPSVETLDCAGRCRPASVIGGDYYDFIPLEDSRLGIAIGDISGKGIPAALLMAGLRASLRGQIVAHTPDLASLMRNVNALLYESSAASRYATFFYAQYAPGSRQLDFVNAGHNPPVILRGDEVIRLEAGGPVVGLLPSAAYRQGSLTVEPGDLLCLYTDGISEAMNAEDEEWDEDRMIEALRANRSLCAEKIINEVIAAADRFAAGAPQHDDMTLLLVKVIR